jgi:hypothetical protein
VHRCVALVLQGCKARAWRPCLGARRRWTSGICLCPRVWQPPGMPAALTSPLQSPAVLLQLAGSLGCSVSQLSRMTQVLLDCCCLLSMWPGQVSSLGPNLPDSWASNPSRAYAGTYQALTTIVCTPGIPSVFCLRSSLLSRPGMLSRASTTFNRPVGCPSCLAVLQWPHQHPPALLSPLQQSPSCASAGQAAVYISFGSWGQCST